MRFSHPDGTTVHLSYCSNVHPAQTVDGIVGQLERYAHGVRETLGVPRLGVGLWLPAPAVGELTSAPDRTARLRGHLDRLGLEVVSLNAFPYEDFHAPVVKGAVYRPDWSEPTRLQYTLRAARVLAGLLPDDVATGSISTLPLGWRRPWFADRDHAARENLAALARGLAEIEETTGRAIRVGLEPEPGCVVETTAQAAERMAGLDLSRIGVCLDTCHLATGFEDPAEALATLDAAGVPVVKCQASAALEAADPTDTETREALAGWSEDRFLHQVRERRGRRVDGRDDLPDALAGRRPLPGRNPWRVHYHVPVGTAPREPLRSTQPVLVDALSALVGGASCRTSQIEVETYTWGVLPEGSRPRDAGELVAGIAGELAWTAERLTRLGLVATTGVAA